MGNDCREIRQGASTEGPGIDFSGTSEAYEHKSNMEVLRSLLIFSACNCTPLVMNSHRLLTLSEVRILRLRVSELIPSSQRVVGKPVTASIVRNTFFKQFCAGETQVDVEPLMEKLQSLGVGGILDYAAEEDVSECAGQYPTPFSFSRRAVSSLELRSVNSTRWSGMLRCRS